MLEYYGIRGLTGLPGTITAGELEAVDILQDKKFVNLTELFRKLRRNDVVPGRDEMKVSTINVLLQRCGSFMLSTKKDTRNKYGLSSRRSYYFQLVGSCLY